ncbi:MAG TPA: hypothetical protein VF597_03540, partial [Candidatus Saccharimonadales bacterium]
IAYSSKGSRMIEANLQAAIVSPAQVQQSLHRLAAANHYQWSLWGQLLTPLLLSARVAGQNGADLAREVPESALVSHAEDVLSLTGRFMEFTYQPHGLPPAPIVERKRAQLISWADYAVSVATPERIVRWQLQSRMPFLRLTPDQQRSDYAEAERDLAVVAESTQTILPDLSTMAAMPLTERELRAQRRRHRWGMHGDYATTLRPWTLVCNACHARWGIGRP